MSDLLNTAQRNAVQANLGNLLVLAGAGSGKTRVLVNRIAWLITNQYASLHEIFAVTFTNKAANEMKSRLAAILQRNTTSVWVGTFHSLAHRLLRLHWRESGLPQNFQVIDADDQLRIIRKLCKQLNIDEERWELKEIQNFINRKKDDGIRANKLLTSNHMFDRVMGDIYVVYEQLCFKEGLVDFGELLFRAYEVLANNASLLAHYHSRFKHFLVDEFQDTNKIQYNWLKLLASQAQSVTAVGDDDQSIYGWRGARIENIYRFEKDFSNTELIRLEQNYRSTNIILSAANAVIACNYGRLGKNLWTEKTQGELITLYYALNEEDEALFIARQIQRYMTTVGALSNIAVLYRSNAQSRVLEEALIRLGIDYCIYGGVRFFERAEIKDALAYLRLVINIHDNSAFERVINTPARGIGEQSLTKLRDYAALNNISYWQAAVQCGNENLFTGKAGVGLRAFINIITTLTNLSQTLSLTELVEQTINISGLLQFFEAKGDELSRSKAENLAELVSAADNYAGDLTNIYVDEDGGADNGNMQTESLSLPNILLNFLSYSSLDSGEHRSDPKNGVQLMTLHSAKGLEFPVVFICGLEEGLFPHHYSKDTAKEVEEERRLCYVGITRAMHKLILSCAEYRRLFGRTENRNPSRFIQEIPNQLLDIQSGKLFTQHAHGVFMSSISAMPSKMPNKRFSNYAESAANGFTLGQRVRHAKFGVGTIVDQEGTDEKCRINVHFDDVGPKWLVLSFAKLEAVT